jgi:DNA repair exonuclease SbcCD ATPase subunit
MLLVGLAESANPIRKVVKLMQEMQKEIEVQKNSEKELFEKFMCICTEYPPELDQSIDAGTKNVDLLTSKIEEESANKEKLEQELVGHKQEKASAEKDLDQATMLREKEVAEYESTTASTTASVEALGKAVASLSKGATSAMLQQSGGVPQLQALVETSNFVSSFDRQRVVAFLTGTSSDSSPGSGEVVGILKQMKSDMETTLTEAADSEKVAAKGYADLKAAKDKEIEVAAESIEAKEKKSGELEVSIAQSSDAVDDTKAEIKDSQAMLTLLESTCDSRKKEWEARLKMRDDEIAAISEAISILNDDDALDVFKKAVPAAAAAASGFLQTRHGKSFAIQGLEKAVEIIKEALAIPKSHSAKLELLMYKMKTQLRYAQSSNAKEFPDMSGVAKMTVDMIEVLKSEMEADEKKKEWCTDELEKSEAERTRKQETLDQATAAIAETEDEIAGVSDEIKTLETEIVDIDKEVAGSTEQRKKEHAEYTENAQMTDVAVSLLEKAKNRLQKFYNPTLYKAPPKKEMSMEDKITASYAAFIQRHSSVRQPKAMPDLPEIPKYEKQNSGGIIGLMDEIVKELEMDKVEAGHEEKTAQKEYVEFMADAQMNRAQDAKSVVQKKATKAELEKRLVVLKEDAKTMSEEVYQAHQLISEVHQACDFVLETFKERAAARAGEIESLENAKSVLEGAANLMSR